MARPNYPPAENPIVVVGANFSSPYPVDLTVTQKFISLTDRDFTVKDYEGNDIFRAKGVFLSLRDRLVLKDAAGQPIVTLRGKILSAHRRFEVYRGDSTNDEDLLFTAKRSHMLQLKTTLDVYLASTSEESTCDFKVKGSYMKRSCTVYMGESSVVIAQMKKQSKLKNIVLGTGSFGVTIYPNVDQALIVALILILHEISKN